MAKPGRPPKVPSDDDVHMLIEAYRKVAGEFREAWLPGMTETQRAKQQKLSGRPDQLYAAIVDVVDRRLRDAAEIHGLFGGRPEISGDRDVIVRRLWRLHKSGKVAPTSHCQ